MPPEHRAILQRVREAWEDADGLHRAHRDRWNRYYGLYRNYRRFQRAYSGAASDADRSEVLRDGQREWAADLFIPYAFATIETIAPRIVSGNPKMLVRPRSPDAKDSAKRVQELLNEQQLQISYDLKLQSVVRQGLKYGLGVQKTFWDKQTRKVKRPINVAGKSLLFEEDVTLQEGPQVLPVDIWDFRWEPTATSIEDCGYVIHRTFLNMRQIKERVESGKWENVDLKEVEQSGVDTSNNPAMAERLFEAGLEKYDIRHDKLHEVWEYHDRENIYTILDNKFVVQAKETPFFHRDLPFQIYRPTLQEGEFVGIGAIEPISHLQYELNAMRSRRADNATLAVERPFVYAEGRVRPEDLVIGPGVGIPVLGDPSRDILPLTFPDLPSSSYREEEALKSDIERTTGVSDPVMGGSGDGGGAAETATGVQLVQQQANVRIRQQTINLEIETLRGAARQFLELNRQHMRAQMELKVTDPTSNEGYRFVSVGPEDLLADIHDPIPDGGSTAPDNPIERAQKASQLHAAFGENPMIDQQRLALHVLKEYDVLDAESFLAPARPQLDPELVAHTFRLLGVDPQLVLQGVEMALQADQDAEIAEEGGGPPPVAAAPEEPPQGGAE